MAAWEYKVISSGKGGFATPALLEKFLNDLGREEWEIVEFRSTPDNVLAFNGLARRSTQRDWTLEDAAAAAARAEAEKLRAEFAAKFQGLTAAAPAQGPQAQTPAAIAAEEADQPGEFRRPVDTSHDFDPDAPDDETKDEWDELAEEDELPTFFDALKPHMRRNQRGPGMAVGVEYLAKKWDLSEDDIKGALVECGLELPEDEEAKPVYVEFDGDLFWVNVNRRGEMWINTKEKPRPVFRTVKAERAQIEEEPAREHRDQRGKHEQPGRGHNAPKPAEAGAEGGERTEAATDNAGSEVGNKPVEAAPSGEPVPLPEGLALLDKIRPQMRRNRRGPGGSGSLSFLTRALRCSEADLLGAFGKLGLIVPETPADKPVYAELGDEIWWINRDSRGGIWINGREKRPGETVASREAEHAEAAASAGSSAADAMATATDTAGTPPPPTLETVPSVEPAAPTPAGPESEAGGASGAPAGGALSAVRLLLKETRTGSVAGKVDRVAADLGKSPEELTSALIAVGLKVPEKTREKPVFVEHGGEIFWFNLNGKGELWVNAKASKFAESGEGEGDAGASSERKPRSRGRGRGGRGKSEGGAAAADEAPASDDAGAE